MASNNVSFQLRKYFYSDDTTPGSGSSWKTIVADNLFLILEGDVSPRGKLTVRIVQGTKVLESVNLARMIDSAISARHDAQQAGLSCATKQLPIYGVAKGSQLAISCRLDDRNIRRMQVALVTSSECGQIVDLFERRGMAFLQAARSDSARPETAGSEMRPPTAPVPSPRLQMVPSGFHYAPSSMPTPAALTTSQARLDSQPLEPWSTDGFLHRGKHVEGQPTFLSRNERMAPTEAVADRPSTPQFYQSFGSHSLSRQQPQEDIDQQRASEATRAGSSENTRRAFSSLSSDPLGQALSSRDRPSSRSFNPTPIVPLGPARPNSATSWTIPNALERELPPRRELPFDKQNGSKSRSGSVLSMPPLPKPKLLRKSEPPFDATRSQTESGTGPTTRSATKFRTKRKIAEVDDDKTRPHAATSQKLPASNMPPPSRPFSSPKNMNELLYGKNAQKERSLETAMIRRDSQDDAPHEIVTPPSTTQSIPRAPEACTSGNPPFAQLQQSANQLIGRYGQDELEDYAKLSREDRASVLEDFMMEMLGNKGFEVLCEDMNSCWQRVCLGL